MSFKSKLSSFCVAVSMLFVIGVSEASTEPKNPSSHERYAKKLYSELLDIRRDLFAHPEASGQERRTSAVVADYLTNLGLEVKTGIGGYGVVGILKGGKPG